MVISPVKCKGKLIEISELKGLGNKVKRADWFCSYTVTVKHESAMLPNGFNACG